MCTYAFYRFSDAFLFQDSIFRIAYVIFCFTHFLSRKRDSFCFETFFPFSERHHFRGSLLWLFYIFFVCSFFCFVFIQPFALSLSGFYLYIGITSLCLYNSTHICPLQDVILYNIHYFCLCNTQILYTLPHKTIDFQQKICYN